MKREIKFRGRCIKSGDWVYGDLIHGVGYKNGNLYILPNKTNLANVKNCDPLDGVQVIPESVGQYTGLTDKKGKEIYEGDWCMSEFRGKDGIQVIQGHIIMDEFMWCIDCTGCVGDDIFSINRPHNFEIIGNIYENPELLNS